MGNVIYVARYTRFELRANPHHLYVFGDNSRRVGFGGQAKEARGEPNAHGIATLHSPGEFFTDETYEDNARIIKRDVDVLRVRWAGRAGAAIVFPLDGIGTGLARMAEAAPMTRRFLDAQLLDLGIRNDMRHYMLAKLGDPDGRKEEPVPKSS